jgi:alanine racemase
MDFMEYSNTYAKIDLSAIRDNFRTIREKAGAPVMAVVKADAYGHGAVPVAQMLEKDCAFFGVATVAEALELRHASIQKPILLLGHTPVRYYDIVVKEDIRPAISCYEQAQALSREAVRQGKTAAFHFAVDTGMSRIGFQVTEESADFCAKIAQLPGLYAEGLFSHFATADTEDLTRTQKQAALFAAFDKMLKDRGVEIPLRHLDNSAGIMHFGCHYDMVRAGIVLYGLYPSEQMDKTLLPLKPAMSWHTEVSHVKTLEPGREISYGGTYVTEKPTVVATIPVGYADGYRRSLSNRFYVLIRGKRAPILGRVCMDQFMVDATDIPGVQAGDGVVLMGTDGSETISAEALGAAAGSFNYEQVCDLSRRVARVYSEG